MKHLPLYDAADLPAAIERTAGLDHDPACTRCPLHQGVRTPCMRAEMSARPGTPEDAPVALLVGEGPGGEEDVAGRPFVGGSGRLLREVAQRHWSGWLVIDNAVRCFPGKRPVTPKHVAACRPYLAATHREAKPARVVALGATATEAVIGRRFSPFSTRKGYGYLESGTPVFFVLHPAAACRNRFVRGWFDEDLCWALTAEAPPPPPTEGLVWLVETPDDSAAVCERLAREPWVTVDVETFGRLHDPSFEVLSLALTPKGGESAYVWEDAALRDPAVAAPLKRLLADPRVPKNGTNLKFDEQAVEQGLGVPLRGTVFDVRLVRKLLQADAQADLDAMQALVGMGGGKDAADAWLREAKTALQKLANPRTSARVQAKCWATPAVQAMHPDRLARAIAAVAADHDPGAYTFAAMPSAIRAAYNARDTVSTDRLGVLLEHQLRAIPELHRLWTTVVLPVHHAVRVMETNGIAVSKPAIYRLQADLMAEQAEVAARLAPYELANPDSPKEVGDLLFNRLRLPVRDRTTTGQPATDAATLEEIDHPVVQDILAWRKISKFRGTYADGMLPHVRETGRIHPSILLDGTGTGRPSCTNPNLMNIPRATSDRGKMCRNVFVAAPGCLLLELDYNQIELRVAAALSGDPVMIEIFRSGVDFHLQTAKMIAPAMGVFPDAVTKAHPLRDQAKIVNFGVLYDEEPAFRLSKQLGISKAKAQALVDNIFGKFKRLKAWIQERLAFSRRTGHCRTWWAGGDARIRPLWPIADGDKATRQTAERSSWNTPVQGTATEFTNASLGAFQRWLEEDGADARLVLTVYDAILVEVRERYLHEVAWHLKRIMESWDCGPVPLLAEAKVGPAWGTMSKLEVR